MGLFRRITTYPANKAKIVEIDFSKPWWAIFVSLKWTIFLVFFSTTLFYTLNTLFPILISWAIQSEHYSNIGLITLIYLIEEIFTVGVLDPQTTILFTSIVGSFSFNAYKQFLSIDPVYHTQQSSGISMGKIKRTIQAYREMTKTVVFEIVPLFIALITTVISLSFFNVYLGIFSGFALVLSSTIFCLGAAKVTRQTEKQANYDDDQANHIGTESLVQANFIRAAFASDQILRRLSEKYQRVIYSMSELYMSHYFMRSLFLLFYITCLGTISAFLLYLVKIDNINQITALSLIVTILRSTQPLFLIDKRVKDIVSAHRKIKDFYRFINRFGKQTFPVFSDNIEHPEKIVRKDPITLDLHSISMSFQPNKPLFSNVSLNLSVSQSDTHKLFGIIGPSGIGKTTLISIIGGQLKPQSGSVLINGYDIYELNDSQRQHLLALQSQTASSLHGSLKYNLTFGLPISHRYSEDELIALLDAVGLWKLFKTKEGLNTLVGEAGMTLSGGQRQRLNFANLYLRARSYKPAVLLIDEPTSSLDEISEQKITDMINQLAQNSVTLVIAHRIKTLEHAQKILDLCMLKENVELEFYSPKHLKEKSEYYRRLLSGKTSIEE